MSSAADRLRALDGSGPDEEPEQTPYRMASTITPEPVRWLWDRRIAAAMLNVLAGPAGTGKSTILYDLAARASREGRRTLVCTAEDHLSAVVVPRLVAAGADLHQVAVWTDPLTLPEDREALAHHAAEVGAVLVTVDPLVAFLDGRIDTHRDASVRQALRPLAETAESVGCAVVTVIHTNKAASDDPLFRISGSGAFAAAARHVLLAAPDPEDETGQARALAVVKSNLSEFPPPLGYRIEGATIHAEDGEAVPTSRVVWGDELPSLDPRVLLRAPADADERSAVDEAGSWLAAKLADGPLPAADVLRDGEQAGHSEKTLRRAQRREGVESVRVTDPETGRVSGHVWRLGPDGQSASCPDGQPLRDHLGHLDPTRGNAAADGPDGQMARDAGPGDVDGGAECCEGGALKPACHLCERSPTYWRAPASNPH